MVQNNNKCFYNNLSSYIYCSSSIEQESEPMGNLTGQKTLPTIWGTYMKLVTKYQISAINTC
jgi:hypothetical protein